MKILDEAYVKRTQSNPSAVREMLHLEDTCKREATCRACGPLIIS